MRLTSISSVQEKVGGEDILPFRENITGTGVLTDTGSPGIDKISASRLADAAEHVDEMTVFEQRRLLRQAADAIRKMREGTETGDRKLSERPHDLAGELRLMADRILRTPAPLLRLAFSEAATVLRKYEHPRSQETAVH